MSVDLSPENEQFIEFVVAKGDYSDRKQALDQAVELLRRREQLRQEINEGLAGDFIPAEEVHERLHKKLAEIEKRIK